MFTTKSELIFGIALYAFLQQYQVYFIRIMKRDYLFFHKMGVVK